MPFSHQVIKHCYPLEGSARYKNIKSRVFDLLENPCAPIRPYFDIFMILLVLVSVWLLIYEVKHDLGGLDDLIEMGVVTVFIILGVVDLELGNQLIFTNSGVDHRLDAGDILVVIGLKQEIVRLREAVFGNELEPLSGSRNP